MIVIVDVNILFSALITPNGNLARLLKQPNLPIKCISCHYAVVELFKHQAKIVKLSKKPVDEVVGDLYDLLTSLQLYNETLIEQAHWKEAERLTRDVDAFDINYVALTLQTGGWLWTGDKKLTTHLKNLGFERIVTTAELVGMLN